ncbi:uncharacterized protein LOC134273987 [Saccostrea cucullata]|uniref:uncharacterized protein LOC134273987 n=1 Tax=Saccostrea cuccullata TaxID=36930 RepID=UPI002ED1BCC9
MYRMWFKWIVAFFGMCCVSKTSCYVNLANKTVYKGTPSQSSSYGMSMFSADKAVDGQIQKGTDGSSCSFTIGQTEYQTAWWKLPLKLMSNIAYLQIQFRNTLEDRLYGFSVYVFNDSSFEPPSPLGYKVFTYGGHSCPSVMMNVTVNRVTKGIALFNSNDENHQLCKKYEKSFATIELCEVFVMACIDGYYGYPCEQCGHCLHQENALMDFMTQNAAVNAVTVFMENVSKKTEHV